MVSSVVPVFSASFLVILIHLSKIFSSRQNMKHSIQPPGSATRLQVLYARLIFITNPDGTFHLES